MSEFLGKTIAGYQLVDTLDEAGATLVYRGFQPSMNRYVTVKVIKPSQASDPAVVQQFLQEGELIARMDHARILGVLDSGKEEDIVYRVTRYAENRSLNEHRDWFYDPRAALNLINGIVEGLEHIHSQGYIHGNLKPSKILLDTERHPLLTDFGFPRGVGAAITPYMAPEQVQGGVVDRRADIYALGVLLYEMLVGEAPATGTVVSPRTHRPELPEAVERVIFKAMAQNPDSRFQTASEFRNALDAALRPVTPAPQPVAATPIQPTPQPAPAAPPKKSTNWAAIILSILLVAVLCVGGIYIGSQLLGGDTDTGAPVEPTQPPVEATPIPSTEAPTEQPPTEPPPEQPTDEPGEPPENGGGNPIEDLCGSLGLVVGALVLGGVWTSSQHRRRR